MNKFLLIIAFLTTLIIAEQIQNIQVDQRTDGSGIVDITYDLIDNNFPSFTVLIELSIDEGEFTSYDLSLLSGDVGENVIPGTGKSIQLQAPLDLYSSNVVVKIIASAYMVTSELPFTMIGISSAEGVSSYQGQSIDYNFEIMQSELTNADLVTFLETFEFELNENEEPVYNCNNFTEYFHTPTDEWIYGCMDSEALNYNPNANEDSNQNSCIYTNQVGCTEVHAANYNPDAEYNDEVCEFLTINIIPDYDENNNPWEGQGSCDWTTTGVTSSWDAYNSSIGWFDINQNQIQETGEYFSFYCDENEGTCSDQLSQFRERLGFSYCPDPNALNYVTYYDNFVNTLSQNMSDGCVLKPPAFDEYDYQNDPYDTGLCIYEAQDDFLGDYTYNGNQDYGYENIENFSTQAISFEGSSFVIESGAGTKPALFDYEKCVDGVIVSLLLDYYGLRIPNGEEWIKSSRQDNDRCWPWMSETCSTAQQNHCESLFTCQTEEEFDTCAENADALHLSCQQSCNDDMSSCSNECNSNNNPSSDCSLLQNEYDCDQNSNCDWQSESCMDTCTVCIDEGNYWDVCGDPSNVSCPCYNECNFNNDNNNDCFNECNDGMFTCMNDCGNDYGNTYEYCNQEEMNNCDNNLQNCNNSSEGCEGIYSSILSNIIDGTNDPDESGYDVYGFLTSVYSNKFNFIYDQNYDSETINVQDVAQYPEGISPFGLYDLIGNAPELIKFNNQYWLIGLHLNQDYTKSFCSDNIFDENDDSQGHLITNLSNKRYGLRLIRTTTSD